MQQQSEQIRVAQRRGSQSEPNVEAAVQANNLYTLGADRYLRDFGDFTMAYSVVANNAIERFECPGVASMGYADHKNLRLMIGDPMCRGADRVQAIEQFVREGERQGRHVVSVQTGLGTAKAFRKQGFRAQHMGREIILDLTRFNLRGKHKTKVRRWVNTARNAGLSVREVAVDDRAINTQLKAVSDEWLQNKVNKWELSLMTRPPTFTHEPGCRTFCAEDGSGIQGFITFDPLYRKGQIIGYYADICRNRQGAPNGTTDLIIDEARKVFLGEGAQYLSLGIAPLAGMNNDHGFANPVLSLLLRSNYRFGNSMYAFRGVDFHKAAYHDGQQSIERPTYFVAKGAFPLIKVIRTFEHIGIVQGNGLLQNLVFLGASLVRDAMRQMRPDKWAGVKKPARPAARAPACGKDAKPRRSDGKTGEHSACRSNGGTSHAQNC